MTSKLICCALLLMGTGGIVSAQENQNARDNSITPGIQMIAETTQAVDYRKGATTAVDFKGTDVIPELTGKARVNSKRSLTSIRVDVDHLRPAKSIDLAYLTYVLWAISPQGQAKNIGELLERGGKASLQTATDLQAFALVITAEPDFAVHQPSNIVVATNSVRSTTLGRDEAVDVRFETFPGSIYAAQVAPIQNNVYGEDKKAPLDLLEARNAVRIARDAHADQYAPDMLKKAETLLNQAEDYYRRKQGSKPIATVAREAVQTAEEARVNSIHAEEQARLERQRKESEERAERARAAAELAQQQAQEAQQRAEEAQRKAELEAQQRALAEQQQQESAQQAQQQAQAEAEQRRQLEEQQQATAQAAQQAQQQAEQAQQQAQEAQARAEAEAQQRAAAEQQQQQSAQQAEEARQRAMQAEQHSQQLEAQQAEQRERLMSQLNQVLQTRDSARGLIVSMPDVLFATGSANLKPTARERLAKVAGILIAYPDIHVEVDGFTDSTGSPLFNEQLSQQRAGSVQSYLVQQGVPSGSIGTHGFGEANPIASNDTSTGRQQNRRVELVVSGQSIGTTEAAR
ncbi:MAG: OmpA/MotB domain protein [Acidobacteriaceae bacterium]|nr:OmpA/MotB domain protein [Acidobacteriaceae bacterium]